MEFGPVLVASPRSEYIELARTTKGKLYKKQILAFGSMAHPKVPGATLDVDEPMVDSLIKNFNDKVCDIVQAPVVGDNNEHTEDPLRNLGEVVDLQKDTDGLYAILDARKKEYADELGSTLIGASAMMHMNYTNTKTGKKVGPTLLHMAITNRPYITNLKDYEEIVAASADTALDADTVLFTPDNSSEDSPMDKDALLAELKDKHGIDVAALQAQVTAPPAGGETGGDGENKELVQALSAVLKNAGVVKLSNEDTEEITISDVASAVVELAEAKVALSGKVETLEAQAQVAKESATKVEIEQLVQQGKVLPVQKDAMYELALSNRDMFDKLVPENPIISLSETGVTTHEQPVNEQMQKDIERLAELANGIKKH